MTLFDAASEIGGQFNVAKQIPGKEEFVETLRYFGERLKQTGVTVKLGQRVGADDLVQAGFEHARAPAAPRRDPFLDVHRRQAEQRPGEDHAEDDVEQYKDGHFYLTRETLVPRAAVLVGRV